MRLYKMYLGVYSILVLFFNIGLQCACARCAFRGIYYSSLLLISGCDTPMQGVYLGYIVSKFNIYKSSV